MAAIALPQVVVALGQTRTSPGVQVPSTISGARIEIDATAWPAGTKTALDIERSIDNVDWFLCVTCTAERDLMVAPFIVDLGFSLLRDGPLDIGGTFVRASLEVTAGGPLTLSGNLYVDGTRPPKRHGSV